MTQHTHDLAAVTFVSWRFLSMPVATLSWETILGIGIATILGAIIADIDNVASPAWKNRLMPWDGKLTRDFLEGHRHVSHSLIGMALFWIAFKLLLDMVALPHLDRNLLQQAFVIAHFSHLVTDSLTIQGVPWLYPLPFKFGFPPFAFLRIRTGGWFERLFVFPGFLLTLISIFYTYRNNLGMMVKGL